MNDLATQIEMQHTKTKALAERLAAIPGEVAAANAARTKELAKEWSAVRSDHDLAEMIAAELQSQQRTQQRAELAAELDHEAELLSKAKIKNRQAVHDLEGISRKLCRHYNDPARRGRANTEASELAFVELQAERGRIEGRVQLSAAALRSASARHERARVDLESFDNA